MKVRIGIDVGGTFTDAVAINNDTYELIGTVKVPTTHTAKEGVAAGIVEVLHKVMEENGIQVSPIVEQTLETSIQEAKTYQFYTSKPFDNGTEARAVMENHMVDRALADKAAVEAQIAQGVSRREALAPYLSDENFDAWFQDFSKALRQVVGQ